MLVVHLLNQVGPVIGRVTHNSVVIMLEIDQKARVSCTIVDAFTFARYVFRSLLVRQKPRLPHVRFAVLLFADKLALQC